MNESPQGSRKPLAIVAAVAFAAGILVAVAAFFLLQRRDDSAQDSSSRYSSTPHSPGRGIPEQEEEEAEPPLTAPGGPSIPTDREEARRKRREDLDRQAGDALDRFSRMMNQMLHGGGTGPQEDLFKDLEEMEKKLYQRMDEKRRALEERRKQLGGTPPAVEEDESGGTIRFFSGGPDVSQREDESNFYFDVKVEGYEKDSVKIRIDSDVVTVEGRATRSGGAGGDSGGIQFSFSTSFSRSLPVPAGGDALKAEMSPEKDKIVVKIPKKKGAGR